MFSSVKTDNFHYKDLVELLREYLNTSENNKVLIIFDSCKSHNIWSSIVNSISEERLKDVSFIGYYENGHVWQLDDKRCKPLGGLLNLLFQNSVAIWQKGLQLNFSEIFWGEAQKIKPLVIILFY